LRPVLGIGTPSDPVGDQCFEKQPFQFFLRTKGRTKQGAKILTRPLSEIGGKGLFTQDLEEN
jgi:porphobilinogen deaminase